MTQAGQAAIDFCNGNQTALKSGRLGADWVQRDKQKAETTATQ